MTPCSSGLLISMVFMVTKTWKVQILEGEWFSLLIDLVFIFNQSLWWNILYTSLFQLEPFVKTFASFSGKISQISLKLFGNSHWKLHWLQIIFSMSGLKLFLWLIILWMNCKTTHLLQLMFFFSSSPKFSGSPKFSQDTITCNSDGLKNGHVDHYIKG